MRSVKEYYESKFQSKDYGIKTVYLNLTPNHYHYYIVNFIKKFNRNKRKLNILDVGCATGYLGAAVKSEQNYVVGIEISETAANEAKKVLDEVIVGNVEEFEDLPFPSQFFDVIICSDIIEHLFNPEKVLLLLRRYLKQDGFLLMVVPNVAFYKIRLMLLRGKWEYTECGIMDYGHIRWFTKESATYLLKRCGYKVINII